MREFLTTQEYEKLKQVDKTLKLRIDSHAIIILGADTRELAKELERYFVCDGQIVSLKYESTNLISQLIQLQDDKPYLANIYESKEAGEILRILEQNKDLIKQSDIRLIVVINKKSYESLPDKSADLLSMSAFSHLFIEPSSVQAESSVKLAEKIKVYEESTAKNPQKDAKTEIETLFEIAKHAQDTSDIDTALEYYKKALGFCVADAEDYQKGAILESIGLIYGSRAVLDKALKHQEEALKFNKKNGYLREAANRLNDSGLMYKTQVNFDYTANYLKKEPSIKQIEQKQESETQSSAIQDRGDLGKALEFQKNALRSHKKMGYLRRTAEQLGAIGLIYINKGDLDRALGYQKEALTMYKKAGYLQGVVNVNGNIGIIYQAKLDFESALERHNEALQISKEIDYKPGAATALENIGLVYSAKKEFDNALKYFLESLEIFRELEDIQETAGALKNIALAYQAIGDEQKAKEYLDEAEQIQKEIGADS